MTDFSEPKRMDITHCSHDQMWFQVNQNKLKLYMTSSTASYSMSASLYSKICFSGLSDTETDPSAPAYSPAAAVMRNSPSGVPYPAYAISPSHMAPVSLSSYSRTVVKRQ